MSQQQSNAQKLAQVKAQLSRQKQELKIAQQLADQSLANLKIENAKLSQQTRELLTNLNLALATFNAKLDEQKSDNEKDQTRFTAALEAVLDKQAIANITDEQMAALSETIARHYQELKKVIPTTTKLDMGNFKIELAEKLVTDKDLKKVVDAIPDSISGKVELKQYGSKQPAREYLNVRLSDGIKFIDSLSGGGGGGVIPQGKVDPFIEYITQDELPNDTGVSYYGFAKKDGTWYVMERDKSSTPYTDRYANVSNNDTIDGYVDAWNNRVDLNYDYVFNLEGI